MNLEKKILKISKSPQFNSPVHVQNYSIFKMPLLPGLHNDKWCDDTLPTVNRGLNSRPLEHILLAVIGHRAKETDWIPVMVILWFLNHFLIMSLISWIVVYYLLYFFFTINEQLFYLSLKLLILCTWTLLITCSCVQLTHFAILYKLIH